MVSLIPRGGWCWFNSCDSLYACGENKEWGIGPSVSVEYEIHLKSFEWVHQMLQNFKFINFHYMIISNS